MAGPSTSKSGSGGERRPAATTGPLKHLVVDTGAIIKGAGMVLAGRADNFWTVPEVMQEVRDEKARHHLETLPFELRLREPSEEAMRHVVSFARQTGDLRALSKTDLKVLALTYMIEREETGAAHLRDAPVRPTGASAAIAAAAKQKATAAAVPAAPAAAASGGNDASPSGGLSPEEKQPEDRQPIAVAAVCAGLSAAAAAPAASAGSDVAARHVIADDSGCCHHEGGDAQQPEIGSGSGSSSNGESSSSGEDAEAIIPVADVNGCAGNGISAEVGISGAANDGGGVRFKSVGAAAGAEAQQAEGSAGESSDEDEDWEPSNDEGSSSGDDESEDDADEEDGDTACGGGRTPAFALLRDDFPSLGGAPEDAFEDASAANSAPPAAAPAAAAGLPKGSWAAAALRNPGPCKPVVASKSDAVFGGGLQQHQHRQQVADAAAAAKPSQASRSSAPGASRLLGAAASNGVWSGKAGDTEDDGVGWITPGNLPQQRLAGMPLSGGGRNAKSGGGYGGPASSCRAGCVTGDFAMQNVLLQMGLPLVALDGAVVRRVRQYVLRCAACFKTTTDAEKLFCPICGSDALERVSCSVDGRSGELRLHLRPNRKPRVRGTKFSLPKPAAPGAKGRFEGDLLLREDQLLTGIWRQKAKRSNKDVKSAFGEELAADVGVRVTRGADVVIGLGKGNPNARRGRERRGKKKSSVN